mmetsp:Transcript_121060/g.342533  ORF Transcript_121060/g.342533 Transcript_121060/m.342533 type:complete len:781 (+) Transcript_121060:112-2454(+)
MPKKSRQLRAIVRPRRFTEYGCNSLVSPDTAIVAISDPGQDLDDEMMYMMMRYLVDEGLIDLLGIVTTLAPAYDRARLCRGTLNLLGLHCVPIGVGSDGGDTEGKHTAAPFAAGAQSYMPSAHSEEAMLFMPGAQLLASLYDDAEPASLTLLICASLKDAALFLRDNEELFLAKTKEVVIMGGVQLTFRTSGRFSSCELAPGVFLEPDSSHNQEFDKSASAFFFRRCQELGIRLIILSRFAAYGAKMPRETYDRLALSGSSIGRRLRNSQRESIEQLWQRACAPDGDSQRKGLPIRCDRNWFLNTFCGGEDEPGRTGTQPVWDLVDGFMQYDTMALFAAVPSLREKFYAPVTVTTHSADGQRIPNLIIGCAQDEPNLHQPVDEICTMLQNGFERGLYLDHHFKAQVILMVEIRDDTYSDAHLMALMLRTLYGFSLVHCIGVVALMPGGEGESPRCRPQKSIDMGIAMRKLFDDVGLRFVPLLFAMDVKGATQHLHDLYKDALPIGVNLVITACLSAASAFVQNDRQSFSEKTLRVILMGGVLHREHEGQWLEPDPTAQNNRLDMEAASYFYRSAQELSVPLVVLSRFAVHGGRVPRALFDVLSSSCGPVGKYVSEIQRRRIERLWDQANLAPADTDRGNLPPRCDRAWFLATFCSGQEVDSKASIWDHIDYVGIHSSLALLTAFPGFLKKFFTATPIKVRAATHQVIGWSFDHNSIADPTALQTLVLQSLVYGARCNTSEYDFGVIPPISIDSTTGSSRVDFDMSQHALSGLFPARAASE